jgi:hypothetical protein
LFDACAFGVDVNAVDNVNKMNMNAAAAGIVATYNDTTLLTTLIAINYWRQVWRGQHNRGLSSMEQRHSGVVSRNDR